MMREGMAESNRCIAILCYFIIQKAIMSVTSLSEVRFHISHLDSVHYVWSEDCNIKRMSLSEKEQIKETIVEGVFDSQLESSSATMHMHIDLRLLYRLY